MKITYMDDGSDYDDRSSNDDEEDVMTKTNISDVQTNIDTGEKKEYDWVNDIYVSKMRTNRKGPVKEHRWVLDRALEHQNKWRPRQDAKW